MRDWFVEAFRYDAWANAVWADALAPVENLEAIDQSPPWPDFPTHDMAARAQDVLLHIFGPQRIWLSRCGGVGFQAETAEEWAKMLGETWIALVGVRDFDEGIDFRTGSGEARTMTFGEIVAHVLRHGAYHRGQLREIFQTLRPDDIPQT